MSHWNSITGVAGGGGERKGGFGPDGETCVSSDCKSRPTQAKILTFAGGYREANHGRAWGARHEPTQVYSRCWTSRRSETAGSDEIDALFGGWGEAGGTGSVLVRGCEGKKGK